MKLIAFLLTIFLAFVAAQQNVTSTLTVVSTSTTFSTYYTTCSLLYATVTNVASATVIPLGAYGTGTAVTKASASTAAGSAATAATAAPIASGSTSSNGTVSGSQPSQSPITFAGAASSVRISGAHMVAAAAGVAVLVAAL